MRTTALCTIVISSVLVGCEPVGDNELIFVEGRAAAPAGDSLVAVTSSQVSGILVHNRRTGAVDTLGAGVLYSPAHIQSQDGRWYVSDARDGLAWMVVLAADGRVESQFSLDSVTAVLHQFAVLPSGGIILETRDDQLVSLEDGRVTTFALVESSQRTGLLAAAQGGVLHLVPQKAITLYNELGKIRWRVDWGWDDTVFIIDISVDSRGRPNVLAGRQGHNEFMVFGFSPLTGEVVRWQEGPGATFSVDRFGEIIPQVEPPQAGNPGPG